MLHYVELEEHHVSVGDDVFFTLSGRDPCLEAAATEPHSTRSSYARRLRLDEPALEVRMDDGRLWRRIADADRPGPHFFSPAVK